MSARRFSSGLSFVIRRAAKRNINWHATEPRESSIFEAAAAGGVEKAFSSREYQKSFIN